MSKNYEDLRDSKGIKPGWCFKYFFFQPYLGRWSNLTSIFFRWVGWNHHLVQVNHHLSLILDIVMITIWFPWVLFGLGSRLKSWLKKKTQTQGTTRKWNGRLFFCWIFFVVVLDVNSSPPPPKKKNMVGWGWFFCFICFVWWTVSRKLFVFFRIIHSSPIKHGQRTKK